TLEFSPPIQDGKGVDFAVFENGFTDTFLELAYVEVSSDGITFFRFENASETGSAVGPYGALDPTDVSGLAGKYRQGFGTPFDLSELVGAEAIDRSAVKYVRLIDVVGGVSRDSSDRIIYDPWPGSGAAGFDLDGIASLALPPPEILSTEIHEGRFVLRWVSEPGCSYRVEASGLLGSDPWVLVEEFSALATVAETSVSLDSSARRFFRVVLE
ncbi:hypothetical protein N9082_01885, partial [Akkermansiaceae bacterium]|nr:hypothetical protein [Akkermansiaceae bacterium]